MDLIQKVSGDRDVLRQYVLNLPSRDHVLSELKYIDKSLRSFHPIFSRWPDLGLESGMMLLENWTTFYYLFILAVCHPATINRDLLLKQFIQRHRVAISALPLVETLWDKYPMHVLKLLNFLASEISFLEEVLEQIQSLDSYRYYNVTSFEYGICTNERI